jgi:hypothetical protein
MNGGVSALARYIHPEFGGFCLTTRLRRDIRVVAFSVLLGTIVGGVGAAIVGLNTSRSPTSPSAATALAISEAGISAAEGSSPRVDDVAQNGTIKAGAATGGGLTSGLVAEPAPKAACPRATPGNEQACSFFKPRRVRVRALTDAPDMARIAVGRVTAPSAAIATQNSAAKPPGAKPIEENSASAAALADPLADQALSGRPAVKKMKKTARRARRNHRWIDPTPGERADPWFARAENNAGAARRPYAREASSARRGFWDWSWDGVQR